MCSQKAYVKFKPVSNMNILQICFSVQSRWGHRQITHRDMLFIEPYDLPHRMYGSGFNLYVLKDIIIYKMLKVHKIYSESFGNVCNMPSGGFLCDSFRRGDKKHRLLAFFWAPE